MSLNFLIIGSGFSGTVLANQLAAGLDCTIDIWDERHHIGGNCHTERDSETGVMVHKYGPHIFNTDKKEIWDFVNSFVEFKHYVHRIKAVHNNELYSFPINLKTINQFFNKNFTSTEAEQFLETLGDKTITDPKNFEEQALRFIGKELYDAFFSGYTKKQWGCEPKELPASILKRIPVRFNYDDNYHTNTFTGIPVNGYTELIQKLVTHPNIHITLNKKYTGKENLSKYNHVFYTGPIDAYFDFKYGRLGYRTVTFEETKATGDHQGTAQINFCDEDVLYTRITEHKHFTPWEHNDKTIYFKEYSKESTAADIPYYPKRLENDMLLLKKYRKDALDLNKVSFLGRLATYRYMDMHHVIGEALQFSKELISSLKDQSTLPVFPNTDWV